MRFHFCFLALAVVTVGCGGDDAATDAGSDTSTTIDGAADSAADATADAMSDGAADASADAPDCDGATEDGACMTEGAFCGGPCTDVCSFCNILECRGGTWGRVEVFPAPCFACGPEVRCETGSQYCEHVISGVMGGSDSYTCTDPPAACADDLTCSCLGTAGVDGDCSEPSPGEVTVSIAAP